MDQSFFFFIFLSIFVKASFSWPIPDESPLGNDTIGTYIWARVDNFDDENNQTYKQYYKTLYEGNSELRILYVGGESENEVKSAAHLRLATDSKYKKLLEELHGEFDATIYSLEHRYYDHSYPVRFPEKAEDFKYLTSQQALADIANFINVQNSVYGGKWITIGGSYPGMLSLWFRQIYPKLTVGAIGSSSPVNAVVNFTSFFLISQNGYKSRHPECHDKLKLAFGELKGILANKAKLSILEELYPNLTSVFDYNTTNGINNIAYQIVSDAYTQIQTNIDGICSTYNVSTEEPFVELAANFKKKADDIQDKHWGSWLWQVCNEFGFFYSPHHEDCLAKGTYDIKEVFQKECELRFGKVYTYEKIEENVKKSLEYYGGDKPYNGTNAIITNSDLDPWSGQGVEKAESDTVKIFTIKDATHCDDLRPGENADVFEARQHYIAEIRKWLKGSSPKQNVGVYMIILMCIALVTRLF